jgi:hypothetical protein
MFRFSGAKRGGAVVPFENNIKINTTGGVENT